MKLFYGEFKYSLIYILIFLLLLFLKIFTSASQIIFQIFNYFLISILNILGFMRFISSYEKVFSNIQLR